MTISANADATLINGGALTHSSFTDNGIDTMILDKWQGTYSRNTVNVKKTAQSSINEVLLNLSVSDASGDSLLFGNSTSTDSIFAPLIKATSTSSAVNQFYAGLFFQTIVRPDLDVVPSTAANIIASQKANNTQLSNRGILEIDNRFTPCYIFYPKYVDFTKKEIQNAVMGNLYYKRNPQTTAYTTVENDLFIPCDASGGAFTVTLLTAATKNGKIHIFKKTDMTYNIVTLDANSTETIEGLSTWELRQPGDWIKIVSDGENWNVMDFNKIDHLSIRRTGTTSPNRYYIAGVVNQSALSIAAAVTANTLYSLPFTVDKVQTIDSAGVNVTSAVSSSNVRMGIYKDTNGLPNSLFADLGTVGTASPTGFKGITNLSQKLQPGIYWLSAAFSHTPSISFIDAAAISPILGVTSDAGINTGITSPFAYDEVPFTYPPVVVSAATSQPALFYHFSD